MTSDDSLVRTLLLVIVAILLLPLLTMAIMMPMMGVWGGGHMWNGTSGGWAWLLMGVVPLLVLLGIGYLLYSAVRRSSDEQPDPAIEELRSAYARGDLTEDEFEKRRKRLERDR